MPSDWIVLPHAVDLPRTVRPLIRGEGDPTGRIDGRTVWRSLRTPDGPAALRLTQLDRRERGRVQVLLEASGASAPKFGPRMEARVIEAAPRGRG